MKESIELDKMTVAKRDERGIVVIWMEGNASQLDCIEVRKLIEFLENQET